METDGTGAKRSRGERGRQGSAWRRKQRGRRPHPGYGSPRRDLNARMAQPTYALSSRLRGSIGSSEGRPCVQGRAKALAPVIFAILGSTDWDRSGAACAAFPSVSLNPTT